MRVLLLSTTTGYQLRSFGEAAARRGVELMFATDRCRSLDDPWEDSAIAVRFHEVTASLDTIVRAARERPVNGVLVVGDRPVVLAALAAEVLGVPGNPPAAAAASANKLLARQKFAEAGLPVPWFRTMRLTGDSGRETEDRGLRTEDQGPATRDQGPRTDDPPSFPCVVKPLGLSGSRGVIRADSPGEFDQAVKRIRALLQRKDVRSVRAGLEDEILVEGFIPGREYALEGVLTGGVLQVFAIFDKPDPLDGPFFEETIYTTPSGLSEAMQADLTEQVQRGTRALGLRHGPVHAECRIGPEGIVVLEIAARPIGGLCSRALRFETRGQPPFQTGGCPSFSLEDVLLRHALGDDVGSYVRETQPAAVMMIPIPKRGIYKSVSGEADARTVPGIEEIRITAKTDQLLEPLPEAGSYLGFIFARGTDAEGAVRLAQRRLTFTVDPAIDLIPTRAG